MKKYSMDEFRSNFPAEYNLYYPDVPPSKGEFDILMKILSEPASRIYSGQKKYELRKYVPKHVGEVFLLETGKKNAVTGCFSFHSYLVDTVPKLWESVGELATKRARFDNYFDGKEFGVALKIDRVEKFHRPISIEDIYAICTDMPRLPHPFVYLYTPIGSTLSKALRSELSAGR